MVRLADSGQSVPGIARYLQVHEQTVRHWLKRYLTEGFDALADQPHLGKTSALTPALLAQVRQLVDRGDRTWTAGQLALWLHEQHQVELTPDWVARLLQAAGVSYKRTYRHLKHKQDPALVAERQADLETLEKGAQPVG
jgi:transposase